jgi:hypothetical protein
MHKKIESGITFSVYGQSAYFAQAVLAAISVRVFDNQTPIALFTDQPNHPLVRPELFNIIIDQPQLDIAQYTFPFIAPLLRRIENLLISPFDKTLALDVDLRLCAPRLPEMFDMLERVEIAQAPTELDNSQDRQMYGMPMFNNGVILYKKTRAVVDMMKAMQSTFRQNIAKAGTEQERRLLASDQRAMAPHFSPAVNPFDLEYSVLGDHWNWRGGNHGRKPAESLVINHHPDLRNNTWGQLSRLADKLMATENKELAQVLKGEIHRIHQQAQEGNA